MDRNTAIIGLQHVGLILSPINFIISLTYKKDFYYSCNWKFMIMIIMINQIEYRSSAEPFKQPAELQKSSDFSILCSLSHRNSFIYYFYSSHACNHFTWYAHHDWCSFIIMQYRKCNDIKNNPDLWIANKVE